MELALTGDLISAQRAYELGLINRVVPAGGVMKAAQKLAKSIAVNGPLAVVTSKQLIRDSQDWSESEMFHQQGPSIQAIIQSADAQEGALAFAEKRPPNWTGR